jgi:hypothetical protein
VARFPTEETSLEKDPLTLIEIRQKALRPAEETAVRLEPAVARRPAGGGTRSAAQVPGVGSRGGGGDRWNTSPRPVLLEAEDVKTSTWALTTWPGFLHQRSLNLFLIRNHNFNILKRTTT